MTAPIPLRPLLPLEPGQTGEENMYGGDYNNWSGQLAPLFAPQATRVEPTTPATASAPVPIDPVERLQAEIKAAGHKSGPQGWS